MTAAIAAAIVYNLDGWLVPELQDGVADRFHLSATFEGLIPTVENVIAGALSIVLSKWSPRRRLRWLTLLSLALWLAANGLTLQAPNAWILLGLREMAGMGSGALVYVSSALASTTVNPDRTYGLLTAGSNAFAGLLIATVPLVHGTATTLAVFPYAALVSLIWLPAMLLVPETLPTAQADGDAGTLSIDGADRRPTLASALLVTAATTFGLFVMSNFAFIIPLAKRAGIDASAMQMTIGAVVFMGTIGPLLVAFLPRKLGHGIPLALALLATFAANYLATTTASPAVFRTSMMISQLVTFSMVPLFLGWSAVFDASGRTAASINGALLISGALSPLVAGWLIDQWSLSVLSVQTSVDSTIAVACVVIAWNNLRRRAGVDTRGASR
jgi:predicted MFS family arabinose efflux permease